MSILSRLTFFFRIRIIEKEKHVFFFFLAKLREVYAAYRDGTAEERAALEQKYGKIFNRLLDEMASMETIRQTAKQCPHCSIFVDVSFSLNRLATVESFRNEEFVEDFSSRTTNVGVRE